VRRRSRWRSTIASSSRSDVLVDLSSATAATATTRATSRRSRSRCSTSDPRAQAGARGYLDKLVQLELVTREQAEALAAGVRTRLDAGFEARARRTTSSPPSRARAVGALPGGATPPCPSPTRRGVERLRACWRADRAARGLRAARQDRALARGAAEMAAGKRALDWAAGERWPGRAAHRGRARALSGQDAQRGTFTHRHAVLHDVADGRVHMPLAHLPRIRRRSSSEQPAQRGRRAGLRVRLQPRLPDALVMWEAQFGDFATARR
jgi:2-oxoglutarate dehydrogenase E1 component